MQRAASGGNEPSEGRGKAVRTDNHDADGGRRKSPGKHTPMARPDAYKKEGH